MVRETDRAARHQGVEGRNLRSGLASLRRNASHAMKNKEVDKRLIQIVPDLFRRRLGRLTVVFLGSDSFEAKQIEG